jgi:hypothetical protein
MRHTAIHFLASLSFAIISFKVAILFDVLANIRGRRYYLVLSSDPDLVLFEPQTEMTTTDFEDQHPVFDLRLGRELPVQALCKRSTIHQHAVEDGIIPS